jgi:hypothetical protein
MVTISPSLTALLFLVEHASDLGTFSASKEVKVKYIQPLLRLNAAKTQLQIAQKQVALHGIAPTPIVAQFMQCSFAHSFLETVEPIKQSN